MYNDHSLYVWDVVDVRHVGKTWSFLYHSGCIWGLEVTIMRDERLISVDVAHFAVVYSCL